MEPYSPPKYLKKAFTCPHCNKFDNQDWYDVCCAPHNFPPKSLSQKTQWTPVGSNSEPVCTHPPNDHKLLRDIMVTICHNCSKPSYWYGSAMVFPDSPLVDPPNPDLNQEIKDIYQEAALILNRSPRGAAALLRLCIQLLCQQLGKPGKDIYKDIGNLVKEGLKPEIQKALDTIRVIGNKEIHAGEINLGDKKETAKKLFWLVNIIAYERLTQQKEIEKLYDIVPEPQKEDIEKRDNN